MIDEIGGLTGTGGGVVAVSQPGLPADTVSPDNHGGARAPAAYPLGKGHTRFAAVARPYQLQTVRERPAGFPGRGGRPPPHAPPPARVTPRRGGPGRGPPRPRA